MQEHETDDGEVAGALGEKRATSSMESGTMLRLGSLTRNLLIAQRGLAKPTGRRRRYA